MSQKRVIAVFGATGAQGGGLVNAILNDPQSEFSVRAVTRDVNTDKAKALAAKGADVRTANIDDAESLRQVLEGAYGAFFVTFFWDHFSPEKEMAEAANMARAAKETGIKHAIWSTLEDTRLYVPLEDNRMPTIHGAYKVPHFDGKGASNKYFSDHNVPTTYLLTTFYWDNFVYFGMGPKKGNDGKLSITIPIADKKMAGIAAEDIGKCGYGIFKKGDKLVNKTVGIAGEFLSGKEMAEALSKALGTEISFNAIPPDVYRGLGFPGADDLGNMFQFYSEFESEFMRTRDVEYARELNPSLKNFDSWLKENAGRIPLE